MRLLHRCFGFAERRRQLADGARPNSDIAILSSPETLRQPSAGSWRVDEDTLRGAYLALIEDGLTADILFDADTREHLQRYSALVVPEQAYLTRDAAGAIRDYVRNGGAVVITGCLPMAVDSQEPSTAADKTTFEEIAGLKNQGQYDWKLGYMLLRGTEAEAFWRDGDDFRPPLPVPGKPARVAANGAQTLAPLTAPGESFQLGALPPGETLSAPAIAVNGFGKGTVIFCALPLSADIWNRGNPGAKYVLQKMVRRVVRNLTAERLDPASVQMFRSEKKGSTLLHLVSYQPGRRTSRPQAVERPAAVNGVSVRLKDSRKPKRVLIEPGGRPLAAVAEAGWLTVSVPEFHIHAAVVFEWV